MMRTRHRRFSDRHGKQIKGKKLVQYTCCICKNIFLLKKLLLEHKRSAHAY